MKYVLWSFFLFVTLAQTSQGQDVVSMVRAGNIDGVRDVLNGRDPSTLTDGNLLYCAGVLESNAERSARLFERALSYSPTESCREEIIARMVEYYCLGRNLDRMAEMIAMYFKRYPNGERRLEVERYSVLLAQLRKDNDTAIRQADRFLTENKSGETVQWLMIDKARSLQKMGKHIGASKILRDLSKEKVGPGVPVSLYMLAVSSAETKKPDDAVLYFNILQEAYPLAVGVDALMERLSGSTEETSSDSRAERLTSTYYSVKVGVFSDKDNAATLVRRINGIVRSAKVEIEPKVISGKSYQVVYVGRFSSFSGATALKQQLETELGEPLQVVAR